MASHQHHAPSPGTTPSPAGATLSVNQGIRLHSTSFSEHRQSFQGTQIETGIETLCLPGGGPF